MQIYEVTDPLFKEYGKIIDSVELTELLAEMILDLISTQLYFPWA